jgi:hypothetical protein
MNTSTIYFIFITRVYSPTCYGRFYNHQHVSYKSTNYMLINAKHVQLKQRDITVNIQQMNTYKIYFILSYIATNINRYIRWL